MRRSCATSPYSSNTPSSYPRTNFCRTCSDDLARTPRFSTPTGQFACFRAVNSVCRTWQLLSSSCTRPTCLTSYHSQPSAAFTSSPINSTCRAYSTSSLTTPKKNMLTSGAIFDPKEIISIYSIRTAGNGNLWKYCCAQVIGSWQSGMVESSWAEKFKQTCYNQNAMLKDMMMMQINEGGDFQ
jgi:hypothetical protein